VKSWETHIWYSTKLKLVLPFNRSLDALRSGSMMMKQKGKLKETSSSLSFPVVLVTKEDGGQRLCLPPNECSNSKGHLPLASG